MKNYSLQAIFRYDPEFARVLAEFVGRDADDFYAGHRARLVWCFSTKRAAKSAAWRLAGAATAAHVVGTARSPKWNLDFDGERVVVEVLP